MRVQLVLNFYTQVITVADAIKHDDNNLILILPNGRKIIVAGINADSAINQLMVVGWLDASKANVSYKD